jgi:uncharacterized phiE125 gp8 family phage protein
MAIPVSLLKSHVRVDFDDDDALLALYLSAATSHFERATRRLLSQQTRTLKLGAFIDSMLPAGTRRQPTWCGRCLSSPPGTT